jgi:hypothetical protein
VSGWVQVCAAALGLLAVLTASLLPVSPSSPARAPAGELGAEVASGEPHRVDADRNSRSPPLQLSDAADGAAASVALDSEARNAAGAAAQRSTLDSAAPRSVGMSPAPGGSEPSRSSVAPAAQRAQAGAEHAAAGKRANIVTVDDLFGIGGNEPLPPEALEAPTSASPRPSRTAKAAHAAPASSSLFYHSSPY